MREHGLSPNQLRLYVATTDSDHDEPIFPNLAADMAPDGPNQLWVADITYVAIAIGFVYLAAMLRLPRRDPGCLVTPGCRLRDQPLDDARLTIAALDAAVRSRAPPAGCVQRPRLAIRGSRLPEAACRSSRARWPGGGNPYDNAKAESFMKT